MSRARVVTHLGKFHGIRIDCPACGCEHVLPVNWRPKDAEDADTAKGKPRIEFNGDLERPSFGTMIVIPRAEDEKGAETVKACTCTVTDGKAFFPLTGQTVDLPTVRE